MGVVVLAAVMALVAASIVFGFWLLISGVQGAMDGGVSAWEIFKIALGAYWLIHHAVRGATR
jgi:uncharacterized membrane protein